MPLVPWGGRRDAAFLGAEAGDNPGSGRPGDAASLWSPAFARGEAVHVWTGSLELSARRVERLAATLATGERARASRCRRAEVRRRFVVGRGILREILGRYLDQEPGEVALVTTAYGRPVLRGAMRGEDHPLRFSLSHADEMAVYAVAVGHRVGIDIERLRPEIGIEAFAARFFSTAEAAALGALPAERRLAAFFRCWTGKEAFVKACGEGLFRDLKSFDLEVDPGEPMRLLATRAGAGPASRWSLAALELHPEHATALAVEKERVEIVHGIWPDAIPQTSGGD